MGDQTVDRTERGTGMPVIIPGGVTSARGFYAAAAEAQIKYRGRTDMAMIYSSMPCTAAGTFTRNVVKAAPVLWDRELIRSGAQIRAVVVNAGIANACTGEKGLTACRETAEKTAHALGISPDSVLVGSTGVIGYQLPMDRIGNGIRMLSEGLSDTEEAGTAAACAIMTTDTHKKECAARFTVGDRTVTVGGMSKGSGMIHPNMGTMLAYLTTDASVAQPLLQKAVKEVADETFNMISVDGDTSTNDTLLVLANGASGAPAICHEGSEYEALKTAILLVCRTLAMEMAGDGEGATKLIESRVVHADTRENARTLAKAVITSSLTKAAVFGGDANWGRVLCALGYSGAQFDPENVDLYFSTSCGEPLLIFTKGSAADYREADAAAILTAEKVIITCDMHMGEASATAWGCDLTYDYVKINADYRS